MTKRAEKRSGQSRMLQGLWVVPLAQAIEARGIAAAPMLKRALIDFEAARVEGVKISSNAFERAWSLAVEATGDPLLGLDIASFMHPGTLGSAGFAITASATLVDAFERLRNHQRLLSTTMTVEVERGEQEIALIVHAVDPHQNQSRNLGFVAALLRLWRDMARPDLVPLHAEIGLKLPAAFRATALERLESFFGCPVTISAGSRYRLVFSANEALTSLPAANADLADRLDAVARQVLSAATDETLASRITAAIIERLPGGTPTVGEIANDLHLAARTLQRRLLDEGVSFKDLLDDTRKQLAEGYVSGGERSQKEIAFLLGYTDVSHFSRAFKGWFGRPPGKLQRD